MIRRSFIGALLATLGVEPAKAFLSKFANLQSSSETVVIGNQMAQASAAQRRHEEMLDVQDSPLTDLRYSNVESRLWRWVDSPIDNRIETVVANFAVLSEAERNSVRDSLTMEDFYTLLTFARRRALDMLRDRDAIEIESAFVSLAMIDLERIDWRDLLVANWLTCYAGERVGAPVANLLIESMQLAQPNTAEAVLRRQSTQIDLASLCGYREVRTSEGVALFDTGYEPYSPEADLEGIAFECALALESNGYEIGSIEVARDIPLTWLDSGDSSTNARIARNLSGCVSISGVPRADPAPESSGQSLLVFLAEAASERDASEIAIAAQNASNLWNTQLGLASGRLCAVIIQRSWMADTPPFEDAASLERLRVVFDRLLV